MNTASKSVQSFGNTAAMGLRNPFASNGDGIVVDGRFQDPILVTTRVTGKGRSICELDALLTLRGVDRVLTLAANMIGLILDEDRKNYALVRIVATTAEMRTILANLKAIGKSSADLLQEATGEGETSVHPVSYAERWQVPVTTYYALLNIASGQILGIVPNIIQDIGGDIRILNDKKGFAGDLQIAPDGVRFIEERSLVVAMTTCIDNNQHQGDVILASLSIKGRPVIRLPKGTTLVEVSKLEFFANTGKTLAMVTMTDGGIYTEEPFDFSFVAKGGIAHPVQDQNGGSLAQQIGGEEGVYVGPKVGQPNTYARISFEGGVMTVQDLSVSPLARINAQAHLNTGLVG